MTTSAGTTICFDAGTAPLTILTASRAPVAIIAGDGWHPGVIGIVASRLCEKYHLPVILFADQNGVLTGSGRSIAGIDLFENLSVFSKMFIRFGGHARAAGVTIEKEMYEPFRALFEQHIEKNYRPEDFYPSFVYDESVLLRELTSQRVKELRQLAPYGEGSDPKGNRMAAVNLRCIPAIDLETLRIDKVAGRSF